MNNNGVTRPSTQPMRDAALDCVAAAQVHNDLIRRLEERRAENPDQWQQISRMIGETNARLGYSLKLAGVYADLAQADALTDLADAIAAEYEVAR